MLNLVLYALSIVLRFKNCGKNSAFMLESDIVSWKQVLYARINYYVLEPSIASIKYLQEPVLYAVIMYYVLKFNMLRWNQVRVLRLESRFFR